MYSFPLAQSMEQALQTVTLAATPDPIPTSTIGGIPVGQLFLLGVTIIVLTLLLRATQRRWRRSVAMSRDTVRERYENLKKDRAVARDADKVLLELDQLARQVHGRLDTQFARLETLIRDADERINTLSRLIRAARGGETLDITLAQEEPTEDVPTSKPDITEGLAGVPRTVATTDVRPSEPRDNEQSSHAAIYRLADRSLSPVEIAQQVGRTTGEVELILSLRKAKAQLADTPGQCPA